jgi:hypothetical protein
MNSQKLCAEAHALTVRVLALLGDSTLMPPVAAVSAGFLTIQVSEDVYFWPTDDGNDVAVWNVGSPGAAQPIQVLSVENAITEAIVLCCRNRIAAALDVIAEERESDDAS